MTTSQQLSRDAFADFDRISAGSLRARGVSKWTEVGTDELGGFVAEEDFGTPPAVRAALHDVVQRQSFGYLPLALADDVCAAFVGFAARRYGWQLSAADVRVIPDVIAGLEWTISHFTSPGSKVLVPTPAYTPFLQVPGRQGREVVEVPMTGLGTQPRLDFEAIDAALSQHDVGLLVLCNPHNPTGHVMSAKEHADLDRVLARHRQVRVFSDEIHAPVVLDGATHRPYAAHSPAAAMRTITATSPSKCFGLPGLKSAQLILTNPNDHSVWDTLGDRPLRLASTPGIYASIAAYNEADAWLEQLLSYLSAERDMLLELIKAELPRVVVGRPEGTYLSWLDFSAYDLGESPAAYLRREAKVVLTDGVSCGTGFERCARLVWATPRPILTRMVTAMGRVVGER